MFMSLYALFISFPVRHTVNFRFDGRHCIGDLIAHTIIGNFCTVNLTEKVPSKCKPKFQKKALNYSDKTNRKNTIFLVFFIWICWFPIDIFVNSKIEIHIKSHLMVKLPVGES